MLRFFSSLEGKFISLAALLVSIIALMTGVYFYLYEYNSHYIDAQNHSETSLRSISVSFTNTLLYEELGLMEEGGLMENQIQDFIRNKEAGLEKMAVYDPGGQLLAASDYSWFRDTTLNTLSIRRINNRNLTSRVIKFPGGDKLEVINPLNIHGKSFGTLVGYYSLKDFEARMIDLRQKIIMIAFFGLIFSIGIALFIARVLARPIKQLTEEMTHVADPYYFPRQPVKRRDEIGVLKQMFYNMMVRLREAAHERQESQQAMIRSERLATMGTLAASIAHDISNPLAGARSCLRRISEHPEAIDQTKKYVELMYNALGRIESMVQNLLHFSRKREITYAIIDLKKLVTQVLDLFKFKLVKNQIVVVTKFSDDNSVMGDSHNLEQVFINILSNAMDAMPDGGTISIELKSRDEWVELTVKDDGIGIDSQEIDKVFDPFYTTKAEGIGTGLGLSICKNILEDHRGTIDLTSQSGIGTVVSIRFPSGKFESHFGDTIGAAILAGGKSSRIGRDKALIKLDGKPIVEKILKTVRPIVHNPVIISNEPEKFGHLHLELYKDIYPGLGPISGIHSALTNCRENEVLILACDLPFVSDNILEAVLKHSGVHDIVAVDAGSGVEPLCAIYRKTCLPVIEKQIMEGYYKVTDLFRKLDVKVVYLELLSGSLNSKMLFNINTPEDLKQAEMLLKQEKTE